MRVVDPIESMVVDIGAEVFYQKVINISILIFVPVIFLAISLHDLDLVDWK